METAIVVAFGFWRYHTGSSTRGAVDFHQAGRLAEPLRLTQELVVSGLAALAWYAAGYHAPAIALAALSLVYHTLVYATGAQLLKANHDNSDSPPESIAETSR